MNGLELPGGWQVTSLISGGHKGWGHAHGAAVDVSGSKTKSAWSWIADQIRSGRWNHIGSTEEVYADPGMQALAQQYGVDLFHDEGSAFHVHLQAYGPL